MGSIVLLLGLLLAVLIANSFAKILRSIASMAEKVASGDLEQHSIDDQSRDEIGVLARSFTTMVSQIKQLFADNRRRAEEEQERLETLVLARTEELHVRNADMRRVLDNIEQAFLTIDRQGSISVERSAVFDKWLGAHRDPESLWQWIDRAVPGMASQFALAWEQVLEGFLPLELNLDQMPKQIVVGTQTLALTYKPIVCEGVQADQFERLLVILSDISLQLENEQHEIEQREITYIVTRVLKDRKGVAEFFTDSNNTIEKLCRQPPLPRVDVKHPLHTIKGNCLFFGLESVALTCHNIEDSLAEHDEDIGIIESESLRQPWNSMRDRLSRFVDEREDVRIRIEDDDYDENICAINEGREHSALGALVANWRLEPVKVRLDRAAD